MKIADVYDQLSFDDFTTPVKRQGCDHVYHLYVCKTPRRDELMNYLNERDIFPGIHYPVPIHLQPAYKDNIALGSDMHVTESIAENIISLPMYPELSLDDAEKVYKEIKNFFK